MAHPSQTKPLNSSLFARFLSPPMLVSIRGSYKCLVKQKSFFFKCEDFVGSQIDPLSPMDPDLMSLKLNRYHWGDDLSGELTLVIADYQL
jgi:hypothetical protein